MTVIISLKILLLGALLVSCTQQKDTKKVADKPIVPVIPLTRQHAESNHNYAGHIEAVENV